MHAHNTTPQNVVKERCRNPCLAVSNPLCDAQGALIVFPALSKSWLHWGPQFIPSYPGFIYFSNFVMFDEAFALHSSCKEKQPDRLGLTRQPSRTTRHENWGPTYLHLFNVVGLATLWSQPQTHRGPWNFGCGVDWGVDGKACPYLLPYFIPSYPSHRSWCRNNSIF